MYPAQFDYYRADSTSEALELLEEHSDQEVELLSGGHSLLPTMKTGLASPDVIIDIGEIESLVGIEADSDSTTFGANTRYATIASSETAWENCPAFAEAVQAVGDIQVRNRGTIGGNIAHSDPAGDPPAAVLASDATIHLEGPDGTRSVSADEFFIAMYTTDIAENEILTGVEVPNATDGDVGAYVKKPSPSSGYAMVGVAAVIKTEDETVTDARVAANGALDHATRLDAVESTLDGEAFTEETIETSAEQATEGIEDWELMDDIQASAEYRGQLLKVYTRRALNAARNRT